jgi:tetrahydromethanopterin S-methyltransferase subunit G
MERLQEIKPRDTTTKKEVRQTVHMRQIVREVGILFVGTTTIVLRVTLNPDVTFNRGKQTKFKKGTNV